MTGSEAIAVREQLGLSVPDLGHELGLMPDIVAAWEKGDISIPSKFAKELRWRSAVDVRIKALAASNLAECDWLQSWENEPVPDKLRKRAEHFERAVAHQKSCAVCQARERFVVERFGEMPRRPQSAWVTALAWIAERTEQLPRWAQPAVWMGLAFGAYSMLRILFLLPSIKGNPELILTAFQGFAVSVSLGAGIGLCVGAFRSIKTRRRRESI